MVSRHEEKYLLPLQEARRIRNRIAALMKPDAHYEGGKYIISSIYFDDSKLSCVQEKAAGLAEHTKFRIRTYNGDDSRISLEKKIKRGIITEKYSAIITKDELYSICAGNKPETLSDSAKPLFEELKRSNFKPACTVRYQREAFSYEPLDIRVTFDSLVSYLPGVPESIISGTLVKGAPALDPGTVIMEVKYNDYIPYDIRTLTASYEMQGSFSKYAACMDKSGRISRFN